MLPTEEELLTCDCPFCVAYRGRSGNARGMVAGSQLNNPPPCPIPQSPTPLQSKSGVVACWQGDAYVLCYCEAYPRNLKPLFDDWSLPKG